MAGVSNLSLERDFLGALVLHPERLDLVGIQPNDVSLPAHGQILASMLRLHRRGSPVDVRGLCDDLASCGQLEHVGGSQYVVDLDRGVAPGLDLRAYALEIQLDAAS